MKNRGEIATNVEKAIREIHHEIYGDCREYTPPITKSMFEMVKEKCEKYNLSPFTVLRIMGHRTVDIVEKIESFR